MAEERLPDEKRDELQAVRAVRYYEWALKKNQQIIISPLLMDGVVETMVIPGVSPELHPTTGEEELGAS